MFVSDYWFVSNPNEKEEAIRQFLRTDEETRTLLVIGISTEVKDIISKVNEFECTVSVVTNEGSTVHTTRPGSHTKTIYVRQSIDISTTNLMRIVKPILAIFTNAVSGQPAN